MENPLHHAASVIRGLYMGMRGRGVQRDCSRHLSPPGSTAASRSGAQQLLSSWTIRPGSGQPRRPAKSWAACLRSARSPPLFSLLISGMFFQAPVCWFILSARSTNKSWACWALGDEMSETLLSGQSAGCGMKNEPIDRWSSLCPLWLCS